MNHLNYLHTCILYVYGLGLGTAYRNRTAVYSGTLLCTAVRTTVYRNSIKLTVIVNLSAAMGIHLIDIWPHLMVYDPKPPQSSVMMLLFFFSLKYWLQCKREIQINISAVEAYKRQKHMKDHKPAVSSTRCLSDYVVCQFCN